MRALGLAAVVMLAACGGGAAPAGTAATSAPVGAAATPAGTIAGQTAQCFTLKDKVGGEFQDGRMCYSAAGIPLLMHSNGAGFDMTFEATAFSTSVTDADFKLPATPTKLGAP